MTIDFSHNGAFDSNALTRELNLLNRSLVTLVNQSSPDLNLALQPTVETLDRLLLEQARLRQEVTASNEKLAEQQRTIAAQTAEIDRLKQQVNVQNRWMVQNVNWKMLTALSVCLGIFLTLFLTLFLATAQRLIPPGLDKTTMQKLDFVYYQAVKKAKK